MAKKKSRTRKPRPEKIERDQFYIDPRFIPKNKSYQWIAIAVMGDKSPAQKFTGWHPVPFRRHSRLFPKANIRGKIIVGDQMLMERTAKQTKAALKKLTDKAVALDTTGAFNDYPYLMGKVANREVYPKLLSGNIPNKPYWTQEGQPTAQVVEVKISLRLTDRHVDAAAACKLTPEKYGQNAVSMLAEGFFDGLLLPTNNGGYEIFDKFPIFRSTR